ncbi:MAG: MauE/DoxX family redox-associated membrane protein, partial [Thermomicrobiales bacterium]
MMSAADDLVLLLARATLAAVLIAAGAAKLVDTRGFATTLVGLGLPARRDRLVTATATAIPLLELGVGFMAVTRFW